MILLIDNYDSFTFNLYQYLGELGAELKVVRNDSITIDDVNGLAPEAIIISPGPGRPENAGICVELIKAFYQSIPILGICLGHQAIGHAFGSSIVKAKRIMHGKISGVTHTGTGLFENLPDILNVMRYHSLVIEGSTIPDGFSILARSLDDNEIMAIKHDIYPLYGLQFHPESIGTATGKQMLSNFLSTIGKGLYVHENIS
ncbi:anthranilate synthase component II [Bacillus sp. T33-2]|uniref:anthranilate synthase component II n=1 Tax=Bacillus sp. T33-2 TaxID=2054168 RepID=UPI000C76322F|nr:aminodeoxychorismate/anthranilate synthase component II [Bacillus sp. T33-2]PLR98816.1 aminodeoxychorismate/anthranilate synthase component II [Bacillus sp. T33-2]